MSRAFITLEQFKAAGDNTANLDDDLCLRALDAACASIEHRLKRRILTGDYDALHSGRRAYHDRDTGAHLLYLADPSSLQALQPITAVDGVTEDGVALTVYKMPTDVAFGTDGDCAVVYEHRGIIARGYVTGGELEFSQWSKLTANIRVECTAGYAVGSAPEDLSSLAAELAWQFYREGGRGGLDGWNVSDVGMRYARLLSPHAKAVLDSQRIVMRQLTLEA